MLDDLAFLIEPENVNGSRVERLVVRMDGDTLFGLADYRLHPNAWKKALFCQPAAMTNL